MTESLFRIVYCSRNTIAGERSDAELEQILAASRRNNAGDGLTGALLYNQGIFAQTLEGTFEAVQGTFERIQADERHTDIVVLQAETVGARTFGAWAMALARPEDPAGANAVLARAVAGRGQDASGDVLAMLDRLVRREPEWLPVT